MSHQGCISALPLTAPASHVRPTWSASGGSAKDGGKEQHQTVLPAPLPPLPGSRSSWCSKQCQMQARLFLTDTPSDSKPRQTRYRSCVPDFDPESQLGAFETVYESSIRALNLARAVREHGRYGVLMTDTRLAHVDWNLVGCMVPIHHEYLHEAERIRTEAGHAS